MFCLRSWTLRPSQCGPPVFKLFGPSLRINADITPLSSTQNEARGLNKSLHDGPKAHKGSRKIEDKNKAPVNPVRIDAAPGIKSVKEVRIPVPWGHIAGKWWGSPNVQPVLAIHDWRDNAASFDRLVPLLDGVASLLAIDLVGHGLSSHYAIGQCYHYIDQVINIRRIVTHYKWDKIAIVGHGFGGSIAFTYAGLFPGQVSKLVTIDCTRGFVRNDDDKTVTKELGLILEANIINEVNLRKEPKCYPYDKLVELYVKNRPGLTKESCERLLARGSEKKNGGRFCLTSDLRAEVVPLRIHSEELVVTIAGHIDGDVMDLRTEAGGRAGGKQEKVYQRTARVIKKTARVYEHHDVAGTSYVHLNDPEQVARVIDQFMAMKSH